MGDGDSRRKHGAGLSFSGSERFAHALFGESRIGRRSLMGQGHEHALSITSGHHPTCSYRQRLPDAHCGKAIGSLTDPNSGHYDPEFKIVKKCTISQGRHP